ncbi:MAG: hypothetical protein NTZ16_13240, partial [Verrucomicrobia bacterium]|nr:hypothetical protein [Verrucomicrobiota bacterium]
MGKVPKDLLKKSAGSDSGKYPCSPPTLELADFANLVAVFLCPENRGELLLLAHSPDSENVCSRLTAPTPTIANA